MLVQAKDVNCSSGKRKSKSSLQWSMSDSDTWDATQLFSDVLVEASKPKEYQVIMLNDDYTPMEFVIEVLMRFFRLDRKEATRVMLQVHHKGRAACGIFPKDVAETKVMQVVSWARKHEHPLMCSVEEI